MGPHIHAATENIRRAPLAILTLRDTYGMSQVMVRIQHPGEILAEQYLKPRGMSAQALANAVGVPGNRITDIIRGRRDVSVDTAIRIGKFYGVSPRYWLHLQVDYDLSIAGYEHPDA